MPPADYDFGSITNISWFLQNDAELPISKLIFSDGITDTVVWGKNTYISIATNLANNTHYLNGTLEFWEDNVLVATRMVVDGEINIGLNTNISFDTVRALRDIASLPMNPAQGICDRATCTLPTEYVTPFIDKDSQDDISMTYLSNGNLLVATKGYLDTFSFAIYSQYNNLTTPIVEIEDWKGMTGFRTEGITVHPLSDGRFVIAVTVYSFQELSGVENGYHLFHCVYTDNGFPEFSAGYNKVLNGVWLTKPTSINIEEFNHSDTEEDYLISVSTKNDVFENVIDCFRVHIVGLAVYDSQPTQSVINYGAVNISSMLSIREGPVITLFTKGADGNIKSSQVSAFGTQSSIGFNEVAIPNTTAMIEKELQDDSEVVDLKDGSFICATHVSKDRINFQRYFYDGTPKGPVWNERKIRRVSKSATLRLAAYDGVLKAFYINQLGEMTDTPFLVDARVFNMRYSLIDDILCDITSKIQADDAVAILRDIVELGTEYTHSYTTPDGRVNKFNPAYGNYHAGDSNNTGVIQADDAVLILRRIVELQEVDDLIIIDSNAGVSTDPSSFVVNELNSSKLAASWSILVNADTNLNSVFHNVKEIGS